MGEEGIRGYRYGVIGEGGFEGIILGLREAKPKKHLQGGSDKSGIFFFFLLNGTTQLKISRFY
jgi:hypothetical protein